MPSICFVTARRELASPSSVQRNDNHERLPRAFATAGWHVHLADHQDIRLADAEIVVPAQDVDRPAIPMSDFDLVWILGFGPRESFLDRAQLLRGVAAGRFVNSPAALMELHAKYHLPLSELASHHPRTYASCDPRWLLAIIEGGGEWVLKPPATSFGRSVFRVTRADPNLRVIVEQLTGFDGSRYCLLQRFVPEIERGEKRILVANGTIVGAYLRLPGDDHRVNLTGDGQAEVTTLSSEERALAQRAAAALADLGVRFAAIDIAGSWLIEFNLVNPGGLLTLERLTGQDLAPSVVAALAPLAER
jgi:glutathione synthase